MQPDRRIADGAREDPRAPAAAAETKICLICEGVSSTRATTCASCGCRLVPLDAVHFPLRRGEEDAANPMIGHLVDGKYRLTGVVGRGGMGTVFRAVHRVSLVPVALKILHPRFAADPTHRQTFLAEARKAGRVVHEHSARILDVGECDDGTVYIAMELVEGITLHERIHGEPRLSPAQVAMILHQLARTLNEAHRAGVVHRDLTPRNIMVQVRDGRPFAKILDFGIARMAASEALHGEPATERDLFANPPYSAPEHLAGQAVDPRSDLYSLGVLAYEALTGRLPAEGATRRDLAQATLEGRLRPLPALPGVPAVLSRLVTRLLALDPQQRPASAAEVVEILDRILQPQAARLRVFAFLVLLLGLLAVAVVYSGQQTPFLRKERGALQLAAALDPQSPAQELRSAELSSLLFSFGGFVPDRLVVEARQGQDLRTTFGDLAPQVDRARDLLTLDSTTSPTYAGMLRTLASWSTTGPVDLEFRAGARLLGQARLRIDDRAPLVSLAASAPGVFHARSWIDVVIDEDGGVLSGRLLCQRDQSGVREPIELDATQIGPGRHRLTAELFAPRYGDARGTGPLQIGVEVTDRAGNVGASAVWLEFAGMDLTAPRFVLRSAPRGAVRYGPSGARLFVEVDVAEPGLQLEVRPPRTEQPLQLAADRGEGSNRLEFLLPAVDEPPDEPFPAGQWEFTLVDAHGNRSPNQVLELRFESEDLGARFLVEPGTSGAVEVADRWIVGGDVRLQLECNPIYVPTAARLRRLGGQRDAARAELAGAGPGAGSIQLHALAAGSYQLEVDLSDQDRAGVQRLPLELHCLPQPPVLDLPDVRHARFLLELLQLGLLRESEDRRLESGAAWRLEPPEFELVRGRIWAGPPDNLVPIEVPAQRPEPSRLIGDLPLLPGPNVLALELRDPLGRPLVVRVGGAPAPPAPVPQAVHVATIHHAAKRISLREPELRLEFGQPVRISCSSTLPFRADDELLLFLDDEPIRADRIRPQGTRCELQFLVAFDRIAAAARLTGLAASDFAAERDSVVPLRIETPAGPEELQLQVRTIRSNLASLRLDRLAAPAARLPEALAMIELAPVFAPERGLVLDPVPADIAARAQYRSDAPLTVRNIATCFLQRWELTRREYWSIVTACPALAAIGDPPALVHACDPLGLARLQPEALMPREFRGDAERFASHIASGPDRAMTGIDFYQAWTVTRLAGLLLAGDCELFRLPYAVELELAALGEQRDQVRLHGTTVTAEAWQLAGVRIGDPLFWPPTHAEALASGDRAAADGASWFSGLDFGVREWVGDLPMLRDESAARLLAEWIADHGRHDEHATALARGRLEAPGALPLLQRLGVVRGTPFGDASSLVDGLRGGRLRLEGDAGLPPSMPGVVRTLHLRRDGAGLLPGEREPHLAQTGMRLAGGAAFVAKVRAQ